MKRIYALLITLCLGLCGCGQTESPSIETPSPTTTTTTSTTTAKPHVTVTQDLLTPVEDYSWERTENITHIVVHFISAVNVDAADPYNYQTIRQIFTDGNVSAHYLLDREGNATALVAEDRAAWHAGKGEWGDDERYTNAMNKYSIGIEIMNIGTFADMQQYLTRAEYDALDDALIGFTDEQYATLAALIDELCARYDIPKDREHVLGHQEYNPQKSDPGEGFDWSKIGL